MNINSRFYQIMSKIADCILLSILWIVFSLPVITFGAASTALYYATVKALRQDRGGVFSCFWSSFKANFKQSTLVTAGLLILSGAVSAVGSLIYANNPNPEVLSNIYLVFLIFAFLAAAWLHYIFSYIAKFGNTLGQILKNTLAICLVNFPKSFMMVLLLAVLAVGIVLTYPRSVGAMLFLPGVYTLISSFVLEKIYQKYLPVEEKDSES